MADTSGTPAPDTTASPAKPVDSSVSRVKSESDEGGGRVRQASGGSQGSGGHKPKLYKQISTDSHGKGSGGNLPQSGSGGHLPKTGSGASFGQTGGRQRTFSTGSRVSYVSYSARRPSLSLSHSDAIPYYMEKPTKEEINVDEGK